MKNKNYQQSKMKKQLREKRKEGLEYVVWKLNATQIQLIEELGYRVEPFIYIIETRTFYDVSKIRSSFLKDIHYAKKRKQQHLVRPINSREIKLLEDFNIKFEVLKYKIHLEK